MQADQLKVRCHRPSGHWVGGEASVIVWLHCPSRAQTLLEMQAVKGNACVTMRREREREREREGGRREREREGDEGGREGEGGRR